MKTVIVCASVAHGNTRRIADVMGEVLGAPVLTPDEADPAELAACDLVGLGSGIYWMRFHPRLRELVGSLTAGPHAKAFVYATSGLPEPPPWRHTRRLARRLERRGFEVLDTFSCRGLDSWGPFGLVGGVNKGRPGAGDLTAARAFAERLGTASRAA